MNRRRSNVYAKGLMVLFAFFIFLLSFNVVYLSTTGKTLVSGANIRDFAKQRGSQRVTSVERAERGTIYSSDNEIVAKDVKKYNIYAILSNTRVTQDNKPAYVVNKKQTAKKLATVLDATEEYIYKKLNKNTYQVEFGNAGKNISSIDKEKIESFNLPGLEFTEVTSRNYPFGDFASYQVGYVAADEDDANKMVGQMGIEKSYNDYLAGTNGKKIYLVDSHKNVLPDGVISETDATPGNDLYLTINSKLQTELDSAMKTMIEKTESSEAAVVLMEAKTGRILAISCYPSFDLNKRNFKSYNDRIFNYAFECGSVFKSFVYSNAIEDGVLNLKKTYMSGTFPYRVKGKLIKVIRDYNKGRGWGRITYAEGFMHSSNAAICNILTKYTNMKSLLEDYDNIGLFQDSIIDGIYSGSGVKAYDGKTVNLEYLTTGFGQGSTVTAMQLLRGYSMFANDGKMVEPHLVDKVVSKDGKTIAYEAEPTYSKQLFSSKTMATMRKLLYGVVNEEAGTAKNYRSDSLEIIGKTGTAQVVVNGKYSKTTNIHSFVGLAPYDDPQVEICLWYKNKKGSTKWSGNLTKQMLKSALNEITERKVEVSTSSYTLDSFTNQSVKYAEKILNKYSVEPIIIGDGKTIIKQYPDPYNKVIARSKVLLLTNSKTYKMVSMKGWSRKDAEAFASLTNTEIEVEGTGSIYKQSVSKGTTLKSKQKIKVYAK